MHFIRLHNSDRGECLVNLDQVESLQRAVSGQTEIVFIGGSCPCANCTRAWLCF